MDPLDHRGNPPPPVREWCPWQAVSVLGHEGSGPRGSRTGAYPAGGNGQRQRSRVSGRLKL